MSGRWSSRGGRRAGEMLRLEGVSFDEETTYVTGTEGVPEIVISIRSRSRCPSPESS